MMSRDRRRRVLGVPVGRRRRRRMSGAGWAGAGVVAAAATVPLAQKAGRAVAHGREMAGQAEQAVDTARSLRDAVSSHSSTIGKVGAVISEARKRGRTDGDGPPKLAHLIEEHTDIAAPCQVVYNQWTQLEMFPAIVKGVESVEQEEDERATWTAKIGPVRRHWDARITRQVPDEMIAWTSEGGPRHEGVVSFHPLDENLTRVLVQMRYRPSGPLETVGNTLRIQRRRVRRDLRLFKHFVEIAGQETGGWRGSIDPSTEESRPRSSQAGRPARGGQSSKPGRDGAGGNGRASGAAGSRVAGSRARRSPARTSSGKGRS